MKKLTFLFFCFWSIAAYAQPNFNAAKLDSLLLLLNQYNKAMLTLTLSEKGQVFYRGAAGYANVAQQTQHTAATRFRVGSVSKTFTAVLIFQLIEAQKLSLDTKLAKFYPQLPNAANITIAHLLNHQSGLRSFTEEPAYEKYYTSPKTRPEMLAVMAALPAEFEPGTSANYSNSNYVLLGYIAEQVTKKTYAELIDKQIARKLGLANTYVGGSINEALGEALSYGYLGGQWLKQAETDMSIPAGAGAIVSTADDLVKFTEALFGGKLVSATSLAAMQLQTEGYGKGLITFPFGKEQGYGHTGGIDGFSSVIGYFPKQQMAFAITANAMNYSLNEVIIAALSLYFQVPYTLPDLAPKAADFVLTAESLPTYAGTFANPKFPLKLTVFVQDGALYCQATGQGAFPLSAVSATEFVFEQASIKISYQAAKDGAGNYTAFIFEQAGRKTLFNKE